MLHSTEAVVNRNLEKLVSRNRQKLNHELALNHEIRLVTKRSIARKLLFASVVTVVFLPLSIYYSRLRVGHSLLPRTIVMSVCRPCFPCLWSPNLQTANARW